MQLKHYSLHINMNIVEKQILKNEYSFAVSAFVLYYISSHSNFILF